MEMVRLRCFSRLLVVMLYMLFQFFARFNGR